MSRKLYIKTHGCQMNEYDSSKMADVLADSHALEITADPAEADVLLLNTCSIREKAQEKVNAYSQEYTQLYTAKEIFALERNEKSGLRWDDDPAQIRRQASS